MPVTYLELENFKSYAGKQRIGPFRDFTSIIGPNGAGKSNLMDAISFILGVQSRDLRSSQLKDLIFRPPEKPEQIASDSDDSSEDEESKSAANTTSCGDNEQLKASATLVYQDSDDPLMETRFSRTISARGVGEYRINDRVVPFSEYERELADIGVLLASRNFLVFQGDVESLARKTPKQITQLLEQVSGSDELREPYDAASKAKEEAEASTVSLYNKVKALKSECKSLKQHKEEAQRFQSLVDDKAALTTEFYLWQLYHIETDISEKEESKTQLQKEVDEFADTEASKAEELRIAKKNASNARKASTLADKKRVAAVANVDSLQPALIQITEEVKDLERKVAADLKALEKVQNEEEMHDEATQALSKEIEEYTGTEEQLRAEYELKKEEAASSATILSEEHEAEYERVKEAAAVASAKPRQVLNIQVRKLESARIKAANLSEELKEAQSRKEEATKSAQEFMERKTVLEGSIEKTKKEIQDAEGTLQGVQQQIEEAQVRREEIDVELEQIDKKIREARDESKKNKDETRLLEAIKSLQRHFPGVFGRLVDLCRPTQRRYNLAATVAGGKDMDAIVVDTKQTGIDCIQYLRNNQIGTATFLPLDTLKFPSPASTERIRAMLQHDSRYKLACDVIACDDSMRRALMYAVGNTVICEDLDSARDLCFSSQNRQQGEETRIKAVTIGGAVISKAGTMTGGISSDESSRAGRWDEREVQRLKEAREKLEDERDRLDTLDENGSFGTQGRRSSRDGISSRIEELRSSVGTLRNKLKYSQTELDFTKKKVKEQQTLVLTLEKFIETMKVRLNETEADVTTANDAAKHAGQIVTDAEEELYAPFREKTGLKDFRAYDHAMGNARIEFLKKRRTILEHLEKLKAKKEYEDHRDFQTLIASKQKSLTDRKVQLEATKKQEEGILLDLQKTKAHLAQVGAQLEAANEAEKDEEKKLKQCQNEYKAIQSESADLNKLINAIEIDLMRLRAKLHETLVKARVEEAEIPYLKPSSQNAGKKRRRSYVASKDQSDDDELSTSDLSSELSQPVTQESSRTIHFSQADDSRVKKDRKNAAIIDFGNLNDVFKERLSDYDQKRVHKNFEEQLSKITTELQSISPNMRAEDAYKVVTERLDESNSELSKAKTTSQKAAADFLAIKESRASRFNSAFTHIDVALKTIYNDMTKSSKHPLGGNAYLSLDDSEEPYTGGVKFNAMPPMKRFRDMEQLSGGEKTVAALALLFAIHSFRPSPFFVMDEVDAALDNVNVQKVCNYISQRSKEFQFIVISLKDLFYEKSEGVIGICRNVPTNSSRTLTLDLTQYDGESENRSFSHDGNENSKKRFRSSLDTTSSKKKASVGSTVSSVK